DKAVYNISGFWSSSSPSKVVIPSGVKKVKLAANTLWVSNSDGSRRIRIRKNGEYTEGMLYHTNRASGRSATSAVSSVVEVSEGDYFEFEVRQTSGGPLELREDPYTWFSLEVVEYSKK